MSQEILPPLSPSPTERQKKHFERVALSAKGPLNNMLKPAGRDVAVHTLHARGFAPVPMNGMVPSGRWWTWIDGTMGGEERVMVNGNTLIFPCGEWIVLENDKFIAAKNSSLKMWWMDGFDLMEKTFGDFNELGERRCHRGAGGSAATGPALGRNPGRLLEGDGVVLREAVQRFPPYGDGIGGTDGPGND